MADAMDAGNFACNAVNIDDTVILHKASDPLKVRLMLAGFKVQEPTFPATREIFA